MTTATTFTPADIAILRQLITLARARGFRHYLYFLDDGPAEHTWRHQADEDHAATLSEGTLTYARPGEATYEAMVDSPAMTVDLLAHFGVVPVEWTSGYRAAEERIRALLGDSDATAYVVLPDEDPRDNIPPILAVAVADVERAISGEVAYGADGGGRDAS